MTRSSRDERTKGQRSQRKNPYATRAKISQQKLRRLVACFAVDLNASQIAQLIHLNRNTVNRYLHAIRGRIATFCGDEPCGMRRAGDASFAFARRASTRGALGERQQVVVFQVLLQGERIRVRQAPAQVQEEFLSACRGRIRCNQIVPVGTAVSHGDDHEDGPPPNRPNQVEMFWRFCKSRLAQFRGASTSTFGLHLRECEFRFNHRQQDIQKIILHSLRDEPLF